MLYNQLVILGLIDKYRGADMSKKEQLEQLRQDVLSFLDMDNLQIDMYTKKNLMKGIINNFFDYLDDMQS